MVHLTDHLHQIVVHHSVASVVEAVDHQVDGDIL
jgi:hypothetical protein